MLLKSIYDYLKTTKLYKWYKKKFRQVDISKYKQDLLNNEQTDAYIKSLFEDNKPMMVSRIGSTELRVLHDFYKKRPYSKHNRYTIEAFSGVSPADDDHLNRFAKLYFDDISEIDLLGVWFNPFEDVVSNEFCPHAKLTKLRNLEPYFSEKPWSAYLKGKKVLVINPFHKSITEQYKKRDKLFKDKNILPEFDLITYRPVVSSGGIKEFKSWFEALKSMEHDISKIDFDIAIIGAGAYGLPLAAFIKRLGKKAFHLGGATQILFGVLGKRWEDNPDFKDFFNDEWRKPMDSEKEVGAEISGKTSYW